MKSLSVLLFIFSMIAGLLTAAQQLCPEDLDDFPPAACTEKASLDEASELDLRNPKSPHKLSGAVSFVSQYISRGISETFHQPAIQGELKYTHSSGFYFKNWASNVDGTGNLINNASLEWDLDVGIQHQIFQTDFKFDGGFLYYYYPEGKAHVPANTGYDTLEYHLAVIYKGFELKFSQTLTDFYGNNSSNPPMNWNKRRTVKPNGHSYGSPYLEANLKLPFYEKWNGIFHLGYQGVVNYPQLSYVDWSISITRQFEWFEISISYVQTNARKAFYNIPNHAYNPKRINLGGPTAVAGVTRNF